VFPNPGEQLLYGQRSPMELKCFGE
jgi:hypothetical protein